MRVIRGGIKSVVSASIIIVCISCATTFATEDTSVSDAGVTIDAGVELPADSDVELLADSEVESSTDSEKEKSQATEDENQVLTQNQDETRNILSYQTHVQDYGWLGIVKDGDISGTTGKAKKIEAFVAMLDSSKYDGELEYASYSRYYGWQSWAANGSISGTNGQNIGIEAIKIRLKGDIVNYYDVYYRVHAQEIGWMGWNLNGNSVGTCGYNYNLEAIQIILVEKGGSAPGTMEDPYRHSLIQYMTHVENIGWEPWVSDGELSGTTGSGLRLEGIKISLQDPEYEGVIEYKTHVENLGWQDWSSDGNMSGTSGRALKLEAIQIQLTDQMKAQYDVYYQVHTENFGWLGWAKNGESAGTAGYNYRLEAIRIQLIPKNGNAPGITGNSFKSPKIQYSSHVENDGWQSFVCDGATSGTSGKGLRLEAMQIQLLQSEYAGEIEYRTQVENIGWQSWVKNGALTGTSGQGLRLETIQIRLIGEIAEHYNIYYRVHSEDYGWMNWVKNGNSAGSVGRGKRLEAVQIQLLSKDQSMPDASQPSWSNSNLAKKAEQLLIVNAHGGTNANVQLWDKNDGIWSKAMETPGFVGSAGVGTASDYVSRTPAGAYLFNYAFGINGNPGCRLPYRQITQNSYWIGTLWDPQYNTWQERLSGTSWDEHLIEYASDYEFTLTFNYNRGPGGGSAFFLHVSNGRPTAGCISVARSQMIYLLHNIQQGGYIVIINAEDEIYSL